MVFLNFLPEVISGHYNFGMILQEILLPGFKGLLSYSSFSPTPPLVAGVFVVGGPCNFIVASGR